MTPLRNGKHELLRNDSDSSEVEEFILPQKSLVNKRGTSALCSVCVTVCWGVLLVVCLVGIGGLVWMCIQLKKDVDQLRTQVDKVGLLNSNIPGQVRDIITEQERMMGLISQLDSGDEGIEKLRKNFSLLVTQVFGLDATTKSLKQNITVALQLPSLQSFPKQVVDLSKNVADLGSNLKTMEQTVQQLQDAVTQTQHQLSDVDARLKTLQLASNEQKPAEHRDDGSHALSPDDIAKLDGLVKDVALMNVTFYTNLQDLRFKFSSQQTSMLELYNYTTLLNTRVTFLEVQPASQLPSQKDMTAAVTASVQATLEEMRNYSRDQGVTIRQNKEQSDSLLTLLQVQITGHESKISTLSDRLNRVGLSVANLENMTDLSVESLNSKLQLLEKELKSTVPVGHLISYGVDGKPPLPLDQLSSVLSSPSSPPFSSPSSTVTSSSATILGDNQNSDSMSDIASNSSSSVK